ncbi:hypothetical protein [Bacteroides nordii]|jgi:hypothetical protein|uniref:hypothetical protein n=1 Tax=Bacteroides nordii TaxID=291645 RepID=UPI00399A9A5F
MIRREKAGVDKLLGKLVIAWNDNTKEAVYGILTSFYMKGGVYKSFELDNKRKVFKHVCPFVDEDFYREFKTMG